MNPELLEIALLEELRTQKRMKLLNLDLYEHFGYAFNYVMGVAERNHIELPNREAMLSCLKRMEELIEEIYPSPEVKRSAKSPEDDNTTLNA